MKGLFVKDIELMKQQKQFFILVVVMEVILNLAGSGSVSFATGYFTIVTAIFAITTISYDEFDNGLAFLMTLPVTRNSMWRKISAGSRAYGCSVGNCNDNGSDLQRRGRASRVPE